MFRIWLDFETGGLDAKTCGLTQLAFLTVDEQGEVLDMGNFDIKPFEGSEVSPTALKVTNKTYDEVMGYEDEGIVLQLFLEILEKHINKMSRDENFTVGAYNGQFDVQFLAAWMERHNKKFFNYFNYHVNDPLALVRVLRWEGKVNIPSLKLSEVYKALFNEEFDAHDALADILATKRVHDRLVKDYLCLGTS